MQPLGRVLVLMGGLTLLLGLGLMFSDRIPYLGKLPGDINIKRENFEVHIPIATSVLLSVLVSVILWIVSQFKGR